MSEWLDGAGFIAAVVLAFALKLLPCVQQMARWRKERGLDRYDPKQFADVEGGRGREEAAAYPQTRSMRAR